MCSIKSDTKAEALRVIGNKFYSERKFFDALIKYNESLCHASVENDHLGLGFANRSAVYFEMKLFDKCLRNIKLARLHKYPQKNYEILSKREEKCHEMQKQQLRFINHWDFFKLSHKSHKKLPFAAECLELKVNQKYGRHIVTNKALKVGDIIAIEKPFCSVLISQSVFLEVDVSNRYQRCAYCLRDNQLDLTPCEGYCEGK